MDTNTGYSCTKCGAQLGSCNCLAVLKREDYEILTARIAELEKTLVWIRGASNQPVITNAAYAALGKGEK